MKRSINPEKLSRSQKLTLYDALQEKKRRKRLNRASYQPNSGQTEVHKSKATLRAVFAGNGSGKTALGVQEALNGCLGYNPWNKEYTRVPIRLIVILDKPDKVEQTWLPELRKWYDIDEECILSKKGKPYITHIQFQNGSELLFMFVDQEPMSFESIELDAAIFDEPPKRSVYVSLRRGARKKGSKPWFLIIGTPIAASWLRTDIYDPWSKGELPNTECFRFSTHVNVKNLADGYIEAFSSVLTEEEKKIRLEGQFFDLSGLALASLFDRDVHLVDRHVWSTTNPVVIAIDPHPRKNHFACMLGADRFGDLYYIGELSSGSDPLTFAAELKEFYAGYRVIDIVCDSAGNQPTSGGLGNLSFVDVLRKQGVRCRTTTYHDKQDEEFVQKLQQVLVIPTVKDNLGRKLPLLRIFKDSKGIINDIENCQWQKYKGMEEFRPKLEIGNRDFLACLKYALTCNLTYTSTRGKIKRTKNPSPWGRRNRP